MGEHVRRNGGPGVRKVGFLLVITNSQIAHSIKLQLWYYAGRSFTHNHCDNYKCAPLFTIYKLTVKSRIFVYNDHLYHRKFNRNSKSDSGFKLLSFYSIQ